MQADGTESTKGKSSKNFLTAGFSSLISSVAGGRNNGDSSDDEATDLNEDEDYILRGARGVLVFPIQSVRTGKKKVIHLNLYKSQMIQYNAEHKKKIFSCDHIVNFVRSSEKQASVEFRGVMEMQSRIKRFNFESEANAEKFHQYIEFMIELGKGIKQSWNQIDYGKKGKIINEDLQAALARVDLPSDEATVEKMIQFGSSGFDCVDYYGFFHMFLFSYVSNLRECLQEWLTRATAERDTGSAANPLLKLLPGEIVTFAPNERLHWSVFGGKSCKQPFFVPGVMYMTNYRIVFISSRKSPPTNFVHSRYDVPSFFSAISIPLSNIYRHYSGPPRNSVFIVCKDYRVIQFTLSGFLNNKSKVETFMQLIGGLAYMTGEADPTQHFFAFKYQPTFAKVQHGWHYTDLVKEYVRQGIYDLQQWKIFENMDYSLSDTYPLHFVIPKKMTTEQICAAAAFRSRGRLPVITYLHSVSKAVIARSAQPLVGITQKNCPEDELLLNFYRLKGMTSNEVGSTSITASSAVINHAKLYILDARGRIAANLNMAAGKGTEDVSSYFNAELVFGNIDNIHTMRSSANNFAECLSPDLHPYSNMKEVLLSSEGSGSGYSSKIEDSGWLRHIRLILVSSVFAAEKLHFDGHSVLVHCSDGWDRTAQICSMTQILLDPYFRTIEGIAVLIEKDWCAFGHKFQERTGVGLDNNVQADERSPVFIQFLDCLFQLIEQFPNSFEFNENLIIFIANHVHSALFGNFLGNSEKERFIELNVQTHTVSIWAYILNYQEAFLNRSYVKYAAPIWPSVAIHKMKIWERYWMRWDITSHPNSLDSLHQWIDDWGDLHLENQKEKEK